VSYALKFTERALAGMQRLDPWLQEEILDELDRLAAEPPAPQRRLGGAAVHDFTRDRGQNRHYVFITLLPNKTTQVLGVSEIGSFVRHTE
jgi:hypothetical protein